MQGIGLVLEGGGMRGVYTAGVLEFFMENDLYFPYVIGVSAGACNACSYISKQPGRNKKVTIDYIHDPRYLSYRNLFKEKSIFGMDFIFEEIPNSLVPFDFEQFYQSNQKFVIGTTDCHTGKTVYFDKETKEDVLKLIRASSSIPLVSKPVKINEYTLLDGGVSDPIPLKKSIEDGNDKNVIILTQNGDYRKKQSKVQWLMKKFYPKYHSLVDVMNNRHQIYNDTLTFIEQLERENKVFVIRPSEKFKVSRIEKKQPRLEKLYNMGYNDAKSLHKTLNDWMNN